MRTESLARIVVSCISVIVGFIACAQASACPMPEPYSAMRPTFVSDFRGALKLDPQKWRPQVGQHGSGTNILAVSKPEEIVPGARGLVLRLDRREMWGHPYQAAVITTHGLFSQTYGHFEMLAKMPDANGMWPAFWLLPESGRWPPEIDVVEFIHLWGKPTGNSGEPETSLHWPSANGQDVSITHDNADLFLDLTQEKAPGGAEGFHTYAVDWRPQSVIFSIDGRTAFCVVETKDKGHIPQEPMYIVLNSGVSAGTPQQSAWAGYVEPHQNFPVDFIVASVKAYQFVDIADPPRLDLDVPRISLENDSITPGGTVTVNVDVVAGAHDLQAPQIRMQVRRFFNPNSWDGSIWYGAAPDVVLRPMKAGGSQAATLRFSIPRDAPPGYYSVYLSARAMRADLSGAAESTWGSSGQEVFTVSAASFSNCGRNAHC